MLIDSALPGSWDFPACAAQTQALQGQPRLQATLGARTPLARVLHALTMPSHVLLFQSACAARERASAFGSGFRGEGVEIHTVYKTCCLCPRTAVFNRTEGFGFGGRPVRFGASLTKDMNPKWSQIVSLLAHLGGIALQ